MKKELEEELEDEELEGLPEIEEADEEEEEEAGEEEHEEEELAPGGGEEEEEREDSLLADLADAAEAEAEEEKDGPNAVEEPVKEDGKEKKEGPSEDFRVEVYRMALPMQCKKAREVTKTVMEMLFRLRMDGSHVRQIHTDQGHEFAGHFLNWCKRRGIAVTKTAGDEPQSNGRAEFSVRMVKSMVRKALSQGEVDTKWWPRALRYSNEVLRCKSLHEKPSFPTFMQKVLVRKRRWKEGDFDPTMKAYKIDDREGQR